MDRAKGWAPPDLDLNVPSAARVYDYFLGGAHNFAADRALAHQILEVIPTMVTNVQANRAFLHRAVRYLLDQGVRQFLDIGSGIPTVGNVHETAQQIAPDAKVLYVDHDPVAVAHSELILGDHPTVRILQADLRRPADILDSPQLKQLIDLSRPVALLMVAVLHFIPDSDQPRDLIEEFRQALPDGSHLVISHATNDGRPPEAPAAAALYRNATDQLVVRSHAEVSALFDGWDLVEPGVVWVPEWHPTWPDEVGPNPSTSYVHAGLARKA
jgi:SAM-dependent methyltransferase